MYFFVHDANLCYTLVCILRRRLTFAISLLWVILQGPEQAVPVQRLFSFCSISPSLFTKEKGLGVP
jgi:hypothetical protein